MRLFDNKRPYLQHLVRVVLLAVPCDGNPCGILQDDAIPYADGLFCSPANEGQLTERGARPKASGTQASLCLLRI